MKNFLFILLMMFIGTYQISAQENLAVDEIPTITMRISPQVEMNTDSMGIAITPGAIGLATLTDTIGAMVILYKTEIGVIAVIGASSEDESAMPNGIIVSPDGKTVYINADNVIIKKPTFSSHTEADALLKQDQEYWLVGDRNVYHKP